MSLSAVTNAFAGNPLDRASERRTDAKWLAEQLNDPTALAIALWQGAPLVTGSDAGDRLAYISPALAVKLAEPTSWALANSARPVRGSSSVSKIRA